MDKHVTDALSTVREVAGEERVIEGIAVPYGQISPATEYGREAFAPGAFRDSVSHWATRQDGARMAFRSAHGEKPVGVVTAIEDTPAGVSFRASIFESPSGDEYLSMVRAGLNGVSVEFARTSTGPVRRSRDGVAIHQSAQILAIAGSLSPAYDGARVSARDMEFEMENTEQSTAPDADPTEAAPAVANRDRAVAENTDVAAKLSNRSSIVITRAEHIYGPGKETSFLRDAYQSANGDMDARERQHRHYAQLTDIAGQLERAGDLLQSEIPGALPTDFLPGLLTPAVAQTTPMSSFYSTYAISDPRPRTFAKVTTSTAVSTTAKTEGAAPTVTDLATTAVTVTPSVYGAQIDVSREVIDASDPAAESILLYDLTKRFNESIESIVKTAVEAGSSASGVAITAATPYAGAMGNVNAYFGARYEAAQAQFIPSALYQVLLAQADTTGRALLPWTNPFNANGTVQTGGSGAVLNGARVLLSPKSTANVVVTGAPSDFVIYRSPMLTFRFSEVVGPQSIRIAVLGYLGIGTRLGSIKVTAA